MITIDDGVVKVGAVDNIDLLIEDTLELDFTRRTLRDTASNSPHLDTRCIVGVYDMNGKIDGVIDKGVMNRYNKYLEGIFRELQDHYNYVSVLMSGFTIVKLLAGNEVAEHSDLELEDEAIKESGYVFNHRIHIPITTNDDVRFKSKGKSFALNVGSMYEIDNITKHSVVNGGDTDRIHIIIDFMGFNKFYDENLRAIPDEFFVD